jgi:drug/metabolite transporter (DMT)-like permease
MRYATHLLFMMAVWGPRYKTNLVRTPRWGLQLLRALLMLGMPFFFITAIHRMPLDDVLAVFWVAPLMIMGLALLLLGEAARPSQWLVAIACFIGVLMTLQPGSEIWGLRIILPLGMAACYSLYLVMTRMLRHENTLTSLFYTAGGVLVPLSLGLPLFWQDLSLRAGLVMACIGLLGLLALYALDKALEIAPASAMAPLAYMQQIWSILLTTVLLGYLPHAFIILGMIIVISGQLYLMSKS